MKKILLLFVGLFPLIAGIVMNFIVTNMNVYGIWYTILSLAFLVVWFFVAFGVARIRIEFRAIIFYSLAIGVVNYIFIIYQMLILGRWAAGYIGIASQFYLLPSIRLTNFLNWIPIFRYPIGYTTGAMFILFFVFYIGAYISRRQLVEYNRYWDDIS